MTRDEIIRDIEERAYGAGAGQYMSLRCDVAREIARMLKDQEPRVMTLEEIRSGAVEVAWIEDVDKADVIPGIWFRLSNEGEDEAVDIHIRDGFVGARLEVYGKLWRCWTSRPSPDQMRDTPWKENNETV